MLLLKYDAACHVCVGLILTAPDWVVCVCVHGPCAGMTRDQLVVAKEESTEFGGYFICNGIERIIRMLILQVCM